MTETEIACFSNYAGFVVIYVSTQIYSGRLRLKPPRIGNGYPIRPQAWLKEQNTLTHTFIQFMHDCLVGCTPTPPPHIACHSNRTQSFTVTDGRTTGETTALIKSLVYCIPQCTGAFHYTCDKGITGPAEYPRTFNN